MDCIAAVVVIAARPRPGRGQNAGHTLVAEGLAWHYTRYSDDEQLAEAQRAAEAAGRSVWSDRAPVPPWEWREIAKDRKAPKHK